VAFFVHSKGLEKIKKFTRVGWLTLPGVLTREKVKARVHLNLIEILGSLKRD